MVYQTQLSNGLNVILDEKKSLDTVSIQVWCHVGSIHEGVSVAGIAHFIEHMLFKGTTKFNVGEIAGKIEGMGGDINAFTTFDYTVYYITIASRFVTQALTILSDAIFESAFDPNEIAKERLVIFEEIKRSEDAAAHVAVKNLLQLSFSDCNYGRPIIGYESSVGRISRDDILAFYRKWYVPRNMSLVISGNFDHDMLITQVQNYFGSSIGDVPNYEYSKLAVSVAQYPQVAHATYHSPESYFHLAYRVPNASHHDGVVLDLLANILSGSDSSRLYNSLKIRDNRVQNITSYTYLAKHEGIFVIESVLNDKHIVRVYEAILKEFNTIRVNSIHDDELKRAKLSIEKDFLFQSESSNGRAQKLGYFDAVYNDVNYESRFLQELNQVTKEDITRVVETYVTSSNETISLLQSDESTLKIPKTIFVMASKKTESTLQKNKKKNRPVKLTNRYVLKNGLRLIVKENHDIPILSVTMAFLGGVRFETPKNNGVCYFGAELLGRGSKLKDHLTFSKILEECGGDFRVSSGLNSLYLSLDMLSAHFEKGMSLISESLFEPRFLDSEIEKVRKEIQFTIKMQMENPSSVVYRLFQENIYGDHPYKMDPLGTVDTITSIRKKDIVTFFQNILTPENMVISVVGDVDHRDVLRVITEIFGKMKPYRGKRPAPHADKRILTEPLIKTKIINKQQAHIMVGFRGISFTSRDRYALAVIDGMLNGQGGRLFLKLRDQDSLAYSVQAMTVEGIEPGFFAIYIATDPNRTEEAIQKIRSEIREIRELNFTDDDIKRSQTFLVGNYAIEVQHNATKSVRLAYNELYGISTRELTDYPDRILNVTPEEVKRVAKKYFHEDKIIIAVATSS